MKNLIYVQDGLGNGKSLAILDNEIISVDSKIFAESRECINIKNTFKLWETTNPCIRIFKKGFGWKGYLVEGTLHQRDNLDRCLSFVCYYNGSESSLTSFLSDNLKKVNLTVKGIDKIHKKINSLKIVKLFAIIIIVLSTALLIKNQ